MFNFDESRIKLMNDLLTIVVPCYNEEAVLKETTKQLLNVIKNLVTAQKISSLSGILFVDDGSSDQTWDIIEQYSHLYQEVRGLKLSRNFGHQNALIAGMETTRAYSDCVVTIDADLQDDVSTIYNFVDKYHEGYDIVYGVRDKRQTDTFFKKHTALLFYKIMGGLGVKSIPNHADFRLLNRRVLDQFVKYQEENIFLRGIIPLLGFKSTKVYYNRAERFAGDSKYPLKKMVNFAVDGITSFSIEPIRVVMYFGTTITAVGFLIALYALIQHFLGNVIYGWTSIIISIWLIGGIQLIAIGIIGEYIGKIFKEVKHRPRYIVEKVITNGISNKNKVKKISI